MDDGRNQEPSPLPPSGVGVGGRRWSLPGSCEFGGYGSAASTFSPSASSAGFVPAERLFQMQWQTINLQRRASMSDVNTSASGSGMINSNNMSLNQPFFGTLPMPMHFPFAAPPTSVLLSRQMTSAGIGGPSSSATALSRKMILESATNAVPVGIINDGFSTISPLNGTTGGATSWGEEVGEQQPCGSEQDAAQEDNGTEQESNPKDDRIVEKEEIKMTVATTSKSASDRDSLQSSLLSLLDASRSFCSSGTQQQIEVRRDNKCRQQHKEENYEDELTGEDEVKEEHQENDNPKPKRPLSAYNLFFRHERARFLQLTERDLDPREHSPPRNLRLDDVRALLRDNPYHVDRSDRRHRKSHGKVSFLNLIKHVSKSWKACDKPTKRIFDMLAREDKARYKREMREYKSREREAALQQQKAAASSEATARAASYSPELKVLPANLSDGFFGDDEEDNKGAAESRNFRRENILKKALELTEMPAPGLDFADSPSGGAPSSAPQCLSPSLTAWADEIPFVDGSEEDEEFYSRLLGNNDRM